MEIIETYIRLKFFNETLSIIAWPCALSFCVLMLSMMDWKVTKYYRQDNGEKK